MSTSEPLSPEEDYHVWTGRLSRRAIADFASGHPDLDAESVARTLTAAATEAQLRVFAASYVSLVVDHVRREWAREAEDRAARDRRREENERHTAELDRQRLEAARGTAEEYQQLFDDPTRYAGNARERSGFQKWAGDRFPEWYQRGRAAAEVKGERELRFFESNWYPDGPNAYYERIRWRHVAKLIDEHSEYVRLETTRELLATIFALGDGTETTWGDATIEQHRQRIEMLTRNAAGVVETAARHEAAIRMIEAADVKCLAELAQETAVGSPS